MSEALTAEATVQPTKQDSLIADQYTDHLGGKFLTFFLAEEEYGLEILKVETIIGVLAITPVPRTPEFIRGVINLRGQVIPVVDLRLKFGMESIEQTEETCIIVVQTQGIQMGVIVDRVSEVLDITRSVPRQGPEYSDLVMSPSGKSCLP